MLRQSRGPAGGSLAGGFVGGVPGAVAGAVAWPAITFALQKTLRSNALKNEYLNYLRGVSSTPNNVSPLVNNLLTASISNNRGKNGS